MLDHHQTRGSEQWRISLTSVVDKNILNAGEHVAFVYPEVFRFQGWHSIPSHLPSLIVGGLLERGSWETSRNSYTFLTVLRQVVSHFQEIYLLGIIQKAISHSVR